jgi:hypothetical protein
VQTQQVLEQNRQIAKLANEELQQRLVERPETISDRDLTVMAGVAADKIAKLENQRVQQEQRTTLDRFLDLLEPGGEVSFKSASPAIDVTPERG